MLPDSDGFEVLKALRDKGIDTPAIFLPARSTVSDRIRGLNLGADDYLVKPFAFAELLARITRRGAAHARRARRRPPRIADLELDLRRHAVDARREAASSSRPRSSRCSSTCCATRGRRSRAR